MTLEMLLDSSADQMEAMSQASLEAFFAPMLDITRPDRPSAVYKDSAGKKERKLNPMEQLMLGVDDTKKARLAAMLRDADIDLNEL